MKKTAKQLDREIAAFMQKPAPSTDPALWKIRRRFGVAGGPDEIILTDEGNARAFAVGAGVKRGAPAEALEALSAAGGAGYTSRRTGSKITRTELGRYAFDFAWGYLRERGLVESFHDAGGDGVRLTSAGERAAAEGNAERARLLERCKRAARSA